MWAKPGAQTVFSWLQQPWKAEGLSRVAGRVGGAHRGFLLMFPSETGSEIIQVERFCLRKESELVIREKVQVQVPGSR